MTQGMYVLLDPYSGWQVCVVDEFGNQQRTGSGWPTMEDALRAAAIDFGRPFGIKLEPL